MKLFQTLHQRILMLFVVTIVALIAHGLFSMNSMLNEQSRAQQKTVAPAIELVVEHLTKPLHISQTIAKSNELKELMQNPELAQSVKIDYLQKLEQALNMSFFIASDTSKVLLNSDGSNIDLVEGEVNWYYKYKALNDVVNADIGKWEDVHFYIDVKVFDKNNQFLGFFGTSKRLAAFLTTFEKHRNEHGIEFFFVNAKGDIMLASDANLNPMKSGLKHIQDIDWYRTAVGTMTFAEHQPPAMLHNKLVTVDQQEFMISQFSVNNFAWQLYLVTPVKFKPSPFNLAYLTISVVIVLIISGLFLSIYHSLSKLNNKNNMLQIPSGYLHSDNAIKSLIEYKAYQTPAHLLVIRACVESDKTSQNDALSTSSKADINQRLLIDTKISNCLSALIPQHKDQNLVGKSHQNQWMILFQNCSYATINKHVKDIRYGLDTLQLDVERQTKQLSYCLADVELEAQYDLVDVLHIIESQLSEAT